MFDWVDRTGKFCYFGHMKQTFHNSVLDIRITDRIDPDYSAVKDPEIIYVMEGILVVFRGDSEWILHENDYLVINSGEARQCIVQEPGLFAVMHIRYSEVEDYLGLRTREIQCHSMLEGGGRQGKTGRMLQSIIGYYLSEDAADEAKLFAEIYNLLHQLRGANMVRKEAAGNAAGSDTDRRMEMIRQFIQENYDHKITLTDLANATFLSTTYLSRYIREKFGKTFSEVLTDVRLDHAEKDLVQTDWPITRIALENGFPLPASFNKAFRQRYKMAPSVYRKEHGTGDNDEAAGTLPADVPEEELDQKIQEFISRKRQQYRSSGSNVTELEAHAKDGKLFHRFWEGLINGGTFRDLMRADMQEHLLQLREGLHFSHVRIWDLYAPELMLFRGDGKGKLNFSRIDAVLDFLQNHKIRPYIELGAKPVILMRNIEDYLLYEERKPLFSSPEQYGVFLGQFMKHCVNRYGIEEVEQWYFEQWMDTRTEDVELYLDVFDSVYSHIKAISPNIRIGGPGLSEERMNRMPELLKAWSSRVGKPDFVSLYSYPYLSPEEHAKQGEGTSERMQGSNYLPRLLERGKKLLWDNEFWKPELHLSEWNFTLSNRNIINDSVFKGAYVVKSLLSMIGKTDVSGYWYGTDLLSEYYDTEHLLNGSVGLITKDRICKPAYYGIHFFSRLDNYLLDCNEDGILATNGRGNYTIVCHNYKHPSYQYYREKEGTIDFRRYNEYFDEDAKQFRFVIRGVENGVYQIKTRVVDEENGSVLDEWRRMGYTDELTANDIDYLRKICVPRIQVEVVTIEDGVLEIYSQLKANAISFIHVYHLLQD